MPGNKAGGLKAKKTNIEKYGPDFYKRIGAKGGRNGKGVNYRGGFASLNIGEDGLTGSERAKIAGRRGGQISSRKGVLNGQGKSHGRNTDSASNES